MLRRRAQFERVCLWTDHGHAAPNPDALWHERTLSARIWRCLNDRFHKHQLYELSRNEAGCLIGELQKLRAVGGEMRRRKEIVGLRAECVHNCVLSHDEIVNGKMQCKALC